jgi:8-oxo-dGTP diphosphatase
VNPDPSRLTNPPGIRVGVAPTIRVANKAIIVREGRLLVTVNSGDFPTFYLCPGGGQDHARGRARGAAAGVSRRDRL